MKKFILKPQKGDIVKVYLLNTKKEIDNLYVKDPVPVSEQIRYGIVKAVVGSRIMGREMVILAPLNLSNENNIDFYFHKSKCLFE
jgi:hypothetical protein